MGSQTHRQSFRETHGQTRRMKDRQTGRRTDRLEETSAYRPGRTHILKKFFCSNIGPERKKYIDVTFIHVFDSKDSRLPSLIFQFQTLNTDLFIGILDHVHLIIMHCISLN